MKPMPRPGQPAARRLSLRQFVGFAAVGGLGTAVHYVLLYALVSGLGARPYLGALLGSCAGAVVNFFLSHCWVYASRQHFLATAPRFFAVAALGALLNSAVVHALSSGAGWHYLLAQVQATVAVLIFNYFLNSIWTFGRDMEKAKQ